MPLTRLRHPFDPHRTAIDAERVVALAQDIAVNGLLQPIGVRGPLPDDTYEVCYGDRRTYACEHLRRETIDAYVYDTTTDPLDIRASENLFHEALDPIEEGQIARRFLGQGVPVAVVCARMGHSEEWVRARVAVLDYPTDVREEIAHRHVSLAVAGLLAQIEHPGVRGEYLREAVRTGATSRTVDVWLAHWRNDGARMAANHEAVEVIVRERERYVVHVACENCQASVPIETTRSLRFCGPCLGAIEAARAAPEGAG